MHEINGAKYKMNLPGQKKRLFLPTKIYDTVLTVNQIYFGEHILHMEEICRLICNSLCARDFDTQISRMTK